MPDRNRDGWLSRSEFLDRADVTVDNLDSNRNGRIERREWRGTAAAFNGRGTATVTACSHGPRSLGTSAAASTSARPISCPFWIPTATEGFRPTSGGGPGRAFNQFDLNGDGVLTRPTRPIGADPARGHIGTINSRGPGSGLDRYRHHRRCGGDLDRRGRRHGSAER